jgi:hypothetical protein
MKIPKYIMDVDFVAKPTRMGKKLIIIVPRDFHQEFENVVGKYMKFHGEEIIVKEKGDAK